MSEKRWEDIFEEISKKDEDEAEVEALTDDATPEASENDMAKEDAEIIKEEKKSKKKSKIQINFLKEKIRPVLILALIIAAVGASVSLVLSGVFELTNGFEERHASKKLTEAMQRVLPADSYEPIEFEFEESNRIESFYKAMTADGEIGYCIETSADGMNDEIRLVVGVDKDGKITKVEVLSISESISLGAQVKEEAFLEQFISKGGELKTVKRKPKDNKEVVVVSGATISSEAVCSGVNNAVGAVSQFKAKEARMEADAKAKEAETAQEPEVKEAQGE